jgi:dynein light chain roadblock-type
LNSLGIPVRTNLDASLTQQYAALIKSLADKARSTVRDIDPTNELVFFRMRTKKHEILVAPGSYRKTK